MPPNSPSSLMSKTHPTRISKGQKLYTIFRYSAMPVFKINPMKKVSGCVIMLF